VEINSELRAAAGRLLHMANQQKISQSSGFTELCKDEDFHFKRASTPHLSIVSS
jgi:hypothetical protein